MKNHIQKLGPFYKLFYTIGIDYRSFCLSLLASGWPPNATIGIPTCKKRNITRREQCFHWLIFVLPLRLIKVPEGGAWFSKLLTAYYTLSYQIPFCDGAAVSVEGNK